MVKLYQYVGSDELRVAVTSTSVGLGINSGAELEAWTRQTHQQPDATGLIVATFVVDEAGVFRIADRHTEHTACAGGRPVRSAGEVAFFSGKQGWEIAEISNQSAGYCPEPESWPEVAAALERIGLPFPTKFTSEMTFRRCPRCLQINIVKDQDFVCGVCGADLPIFWNIA